jgi:hypothetical protein
MRTVAFEQGHALVIGIGSYQYVPNANIPISATGAKPVRDVLQNNTSCGYPPGYITLSHDDMASREGILRALAARTSPNNTMLLYYCGHSEFGSGGNYCLTTHETRLAKDEPKVQPGTGIQESELLDGLREFEAQRPLLLFNACHTQALLDALRDRGYVTSNHGCISAFSLYESMISR